MSVRSGYQGRHRRGARRLTLLQRAGATAVLGGGLGLAGLALAPVASADAPVQVGWWNTASGGGQAAPEPQTPAGGIHVAVMPGNVLAYGAVLYQVPPGATGTLTLALQNVVGTPVLEACPTKTTGWKAGDDQPADTAPGYDCSTHAYTGSVAPDNSSVTFYVDDAAATGGSLSLAIVPVMTDQLPGLGTQVPADTTQPFSVDIDKPGASSLAVTAPPTGGTGGTGGTGPGAGAPSQTPRSGSTAPAAGSGAGSSAAVGVPAGADAGAASAALAGALPAASGTTSAAGAGTAPLVASTTPAPEAGTTTARPAAAVAPLTDQRARNTALALLAVIGMGVIAMSSGQLQARAPRLLGGAARIAGARGVPAAAASTAGTTPAAGPVRGIGRFARARDRAARPLI